MAPARRRRVLPRPVGRGSSQAMSRRRGPAAASTDVGLLSAGIALAKAPAHAGAKRKEPWGAKYHATLNISHHRSSGNGLAAPLRHCPICPCSHIALRAAGQSHVTRSNLHHGNESDVLSVEDLKVSVLSDYSPFADEVTLRRQEL